MRTPWQVLGLDPGSSPEQIRAAYARLLRQHRPDVDPEGFRELREAYEQLGGGGRARRAARMPLPFGRPAAAPADRDGDEREPAAGAPPGPRRPGLLQRLQRALGRTAAEPRRRARVLRVLLQLWRGSRGGAFAALLARECERDPTALRAWLQPDDVREAIARGFAAVPLGLLRSHFAAGNWGAAEILLATIEAACAEGLDPPRAALLLEAARWTAVASPNVAERFVDLAFRSRMVVDRVDDLDLRIHIGKEVRRRSEQDRMLLTRVLFDPGVGPQDPAVAAAQAMVARLRGSAPLLQRQFEARFPALPPLSPSPVAPRRGVVTRQRGRSAWSSRTPPLAWFMAVVVCLNLMRLCAHSYPPPGGKGTFYLPPTPQQVERWSNPDRPPSRRGGSGAHEPPSIAPPGEKR